MKMLLFKDLKIGAAFRWRTVLGAGDTFRKVSEMTVRNLTLKTDERGLGYFTQDDPVKPLDNHKP